ncbi:MAG: SusC/RagA family TonB-linked outer membrane protein [Bacteroidota bacterium]
MKNRLTQKFVSGNSIRRVLVLLPFLGMMLMNHSLFAQSRTVSGTVIESTTKTPLTGVSIVVEGTTTGALTNENGEYTITAPSDASVLLFNFIGYETQKITVGGQSTIDVSMVSSNIVLDDVVITALGVERKTKALAYSVTEVDGSNFTKAREINIANSLAGQVAGVNIANPATGKAGSARIVIRGNASISGNNQPLIVVDGIPIDNSNLGSAGMWGGSDQGDGISSINPDDVASISVLKGATAAALYGSRASNGVLLITTKTGKSRQGIGVELNSNFVLDDVFNLYDFQDQYGHGNRGAAPTTAEEARDFGLYAWGGRLNGSNVIQFDGQSRPYSNQGDNLARFYETGTTFTNTLSLSGGNETANFRFSASNLDNDDIVPNAGLNRKTFTANVGGAFGKLTSRISATYVRENVDNRPRLSDSPGNANYTVGSLPPSINVEDMMGDPNKLGANEDGLELQFNDNIFVTNPYWAAHQFFQNNFKERLMGSILLNYEFTDWLYLQGRVGIDGFTRKNRSYTPYGTAYSSLGGINESFSRFYETNQDLMLGVRKQFGNGFGIDAFVGGNQMFRKSESLSVGGGPLIAPFVHSLGNVPQRNGGFGFSELGINSLYGSVELSYGEFIYLTATARQDWFSVLTAPTSAPDLEVENAELYPSIGASFVFSEALDMPSFITFGKLRASWAQTANSGAVGPYALVLPYALNGSHLGAPIGNISGGRIPPIAPTPPTFTEYEIGLDVRFFENRLGVDFTYYNNRTEDDLLPGTISGTSGYGSAFQKVGGMSNKGVELLINANLVRGNDFNWDLSFNLAKNTNTVESLGPDIGETGIRVAESRTRNAYIHQVAGLPYSQIMGFPFLRNDAGQLILDDNNLPQRDNANFGPLGTGVHDLTMGIMNNINWKGISLSALVDIKTGAFIYNATNAYSYLRGLHSETLEGREGGVNVVGVNANGESINTTVDAQDYYQRIAFNVSEQFVEDADFAKLRQITIGYTLPQSIMSKLPLNQITVSAVGRNLAILWRKTTNIDPESLYSTGNGQGLEMFGVPTTRSYGFNLNIKF